jgi:CheY-like chemotaxis protein
MQDLTPGSAPQAPPATVLVVEDDPDVLDAVQTALAARGYRVLTARDGLKALTVLAGTAVDLILLDLTMPVMSGWEFLEQKRADPQLADVPVVVVTAVGSVIGDAEDPPWVAVVQKPFRLQNLLATVDRCRRRPERPARQGQGPAGPA